ncbi:uncharacterized protein LOC123470616 [Daphnia magna]|uniref:uncharacterized protein LOC123470616 n=1 Tax=Daphnia magna TaxID=35525 RepID=UPI001E1BCB9C|nr:uncharacterized protein LOC123470616 [Daphnia magna]
MATNYGNRLYGVVMKVQPFMDPFPDIPFFSFGFPSFRELAGVDDSAVLGKGNQYSNECSGYVVNLSTSIDLPSKSTTPSRSDMRILKLGDYSDEIATQWTKILDRRTALPSTTLLLALILRFILAFVITAEDITALTIDQCRGCQKVLRQKITGCCTRIRKVITNKLSRREATRLLDDARTLLGDSGPINDRLLELLEEAEGEQQQESFLRYGGDVDAVADEVDAYLSSREGDISSVPGWDPADPEVLATRQRAQDAAKVYEEASKAAEAALKEMEAAKQSVQDLGGEKALNDDREDDFRSIISVPPYRPVARVHAPDEWIDDHRSGREKPFVYSGDHRHTSVRVDLEVYSGRALDWFEWIDLFHSLVHQTGKAPGEKLAILKRNVRGETADLVYGLGGGALAYKEFIRRLKGTCGSRAVIRAAHLQALDRVEPPTPATFRRFAEKKLQPHDQLHWNDGQRGGLERRTMNEFGLWLCTRAAAYQNAYSIAAEEHQRSNNPARPPQAVNNPYHQKRHSWAHQASTNQRAGPARGAPAPTPREGTTPAPKTSYCFKCEGEHRLADCQFFKNMPVAGRMTFLMVRGLYNCCFGVRHGASNCSFKKECGKDGCKAFHHPLIHTDRGLPERTGTLHSARATSGTIAFGVIRLDAMNADRELVPINVMLDAGSNTTFIREGLVRSLRISGERQTLRVQGVADAASTHPNSEELFLQLMTACSDMVTLRGSTLKTVTQPVPVYNWEQLRHRWTNLNDLPPLRSSGGRIDVLIGLNHTTLITPTDYRLGADDEPAAIKTRLGWTILGVLGSGSTTEALCHRAFASPDVHIAAELVEQLRRFCDTESFGTEYQGAGMSTDDRRAVDKLDAETKKLDVGYQAPILWKDEEPPLLPDNRSVADSRLRPLLNKLARDPAYETHYRESMAKNFAEGYARRLSATEVEERPTRYWLPHFAVPKVAGRPELRLVFDAAAKYRGRSLNDYVTLGPALQNPLPAVILHFREVEVAWSADRGAMFSRIRLDDMDRRYLRFLWPEGDGTVTTCEMTRVTFGVSCSPYTAIRTTWRAADDAAVDQGEAATAIRKYLYVDDYLDSSKTTDEALRRATAVNKALSSGDFHLTHWVTNDARLMEQLSLPDPKESSVNTANLGADDAERRSTRAGLLSKVAGLFDPLGAAAPMTVKAKIRLRHLGVKGLRWEDAVTGLDREWWENYFDTIEQLRTVEFSRCLFPDEDQIVRTELDTFVDASEEACAAVCFIRNVYGDQRVIVRFIKAVTKLAPLKTVSVCKLELNAGLLGARLARFVESSLTRKIAARRFWTDSSTVRNWVRALSGDYQIYVSNRIGEIQTLTDPSEWRFVSGVLNPADAATRSQLGDRAIPAWWLDGPPFLYQEETAWPQDLPWTLEKAEIRGARAHLSDVVAETIVPFDWKTVKIAAGDVPTLIRLENDYLDLVRRCQRETYPEEISRLERGKAIRPTSTLQPLTPFLDAERVLRLGGRLSRTNLPYEVLHPPILSGRHLLARAIIRTFHEQLHHSGTDMVLAQVRQHFWITAGREAVKRARSECLACRRFRPKAALQMMADVHKARLGAHQPPFTYTFVSTILALLTSPTTEGRPSDGAPCSRA